MLKFSVTLIMVLHILYQASNDIPDHKRISGIWRVTRLEEDGAEKARYFPDKGWYIFSGDFMFTCMGRKITRIQTFELFPDKNPKQIVFRSLNPDAAPKVGIYSIKNGTLKICMGQSPNDIPKSFTTKKGSGRILGFFEYLK